MKSRSTMRARIAAAALAAVMTVGMGMPAWAGHSEITTNGKVGSSEESTFTYAGVKGGTTTFDKYLVINQPSYKATVPNVTFSFSIAPGTAIAADAEKKTMAVYAGGDGTTSTGTPTISGEGKATFSPDDIEDIAEEAGATQDKTISFKTESDTDESYASKMMTVDFSGVTFKEPGIYRWIITETAVNDVTGISNDDDLDRTLDVYVSDKNDGTGTLEVKSYVLHEGTEAPAANATKESNATTIDASNTDKKSTGFTNYYDTYEIVIGKEVTGNEAVLIVSIVLCKPLNLSGRKSRLLSRKTPTPLLLNVPASLTNPSIIILPRRLYYDMPVFFYSFKVRFNLGG